MARKPKTDELVANAAGDAPKSSVVWREEKMKTQYANVVNVQSTREQVDLFFGTNLTWSPETGGQMTVELTNRIMVSPLAAKRLSTILAAVLHEHERRYGALEVE